MIGCAGVGYYLHPEERPTVIARSAKVVLLILRAPVTTALPLTGLAPVPGITPWMAPRYPGLTSRTRGLPKRYDLIQPYVLSAYRRSAARAFWSSAAMAEVNRWYAPATWAHFAISNATLTPVADLRIYPPPAHAARAHVLARNRLSTVSWRHNRAILGERSHSAAKAHQHLSVVLIRSSHGHRHP